MTEQRVDIQENYLEISTTKHIDFSTRYMPPPVLDSSAFLLGTILKNSLAILAIIGASELTTNGELFFNGKVLMHIMCE